MATLSGLAILLASWAFIVYAVATVPWHSGIPGFVWEALVFLFLGTAVLIVGSTLRARATRKAAYRPCPACRAPNLWLATHGSRCGAALPLSSNP